MLPTLPISKEFSWAGHQHKATTIPNWTHQSFQSLQLNHLVFLFIFAVSDQPYDKAVNQPVTDKVYPLTDTDQPLTDTDQPVTDTDQPLTDSD